MDLDGKIRHTLVTGVYEQVQFDVYKGNCLALAEVYTLVSAILVSICSAHNKETQKLSMCSWFLPVSVARSLLVDVKHMNNGVPLQESL